MRDLLTRTGFPASWILKDWISLGCGLLAVLSTLVALWLEHLADERLELASLPEPPYDPMKPEEADALQERLAEERALRRATASKGRMFGRLRNAAYTLAVLAAFVAAEPWLAILALLAIASVSTYASVELRREPRSTAARLDILRLYREARTHSTSGPYMLDITIYSDIDRVFSMCDRELDAFAQEMRLAVIEIRNKHRAYIAENQSQHGAPPGGA
ncbi:MAG TPA: hypothetical protein VGF86_13095 [Candidatus Tumulicola sp.]|jgi:hypothetical protein